MAQKVVGYVKLQIPAGKATPAPPVGPALGQHGVNIAAFTKEFNERTKNVAENIVKALEGRYNLTHCEAKWSCGTDPHPLHTRGEPRRARRLETGVSQGTRIFNISTDFCD
mgnify:CR=1 FL=1